MRWFVALADVLINCLSSLAFVYLGALAGGLDPSISAVALLYGVSWLYGLFGLIIALGAVSTVVCWWSGYPLNE